MGGFDGHSLDAPGVGTPTDAVYVDAVGNVGIGVNRNPIETLESKISFTLSQYKNSIKIKELDGSAWINELKNILEMFLSEFIRNLTN